DGARNVCHVSECAPLYSHALLWSFRNIVRRCLSADGSVRVSRLFSLYANVRATDTLSVFDRGPPRCGMSTNGAVPFYQSADGAVGSPDAAAMSSPIRPRS